MTQRHVGQCYMTFLSFYYNGKIGFHVGFIKTWKGIPCISWLEVSCSKISINHRNTRMITTLLKKTPRGLRQVFTNNYINLPISLFDFDCSSLAKKNALYMSANVFSMQALGTLPLRLLMEKGPTFNVVAWATQRSSRLQCKRSTFISQLF